jgi:hypothetical protein
MQGDNDYDLPMEVDRGDTFEDDIEGDPFATWRLAIAKPNAPRAGAARHPFSAI